MVTNPGYNQRQDREECVDIRGFWANQSFRKFTVFQLTSFKKTTKRSFKATGMTTKIYGAEFYESGFFG